jgi:hypothetical protein
MKISYEIKGITLNEYDMYDIKKYYEAACTAEYVMENYDITDEGEALELGYEVRRLMDKYGYYEEEAIEQVIAEREEN